jgi:hypothetical protein
MWACTALWHHTCRARRSSQSKWRFEPRALTHPTMVATSRVWAQEWWCSGRSRQDGLEVSLLLDPFDKTSVVVLGAITWSK